MMEFTDMELMMYADGELPAERARTLAARLPADESLRRRLDVFLQTRAPLAAAFDEILSEPLPARLRDTVLRGTPPVRAVSEPARGLLARLRGAVTRTADTLAEMLASPVLATGLVIAIVAAGSVGWVAGRASAPSPLIAMTPVGLRAAGALADTLEHGASAVAHQAADASVLPVMTFETKAGRFCREYRIRRADSARDFAGLACRAGEGDWHVTLHVETPKAAAAGASYQTAAATPNPTIDAVVTEIMRGDAFGPDDESLLLRNGWAPR